MPCRDDWGVNITRTTPRENRHGMELSDFEAVLCGLFTALEGKEQINDMLPLWLSNVDWKEAGVTRKKVETWWKKHKAADETRRKLEAALRKKAELKASALAKLTTEEREVLGI